MKSPFVRRLSLEHTHVVEVAGRQATLGMLLRSELLRLGGSSSSQFSCLHVAPPRGDIDPE